MKIYVSEYGSCIGYCFLGDKNQEYVINSFNKKKDENNTVLAIEKVLFFIMANKPLYAEKTPEVYVNTTLDLETLYKSSIVNKFKRDKKLELEIKDKKEFTKRDNYYMMIATNKAKFLNMFNVSYNKER